MQCFVTYHTELLRKQPLTSFQGFLVLITDNTPGAEVNPGFRDRKDARSHFLLVRARGIAWLPLPRENPSTLIFSPRLVDPMWYFAYASHMNRRHIEARVQRTQLPWVLARLDGDTVQFN